MLLLIDKTGKIIFKGQPLKIKTFETYIEKLRKGVEVEICENETQVESGDEFKEVDVLGINQEIDRLAKVSNELLKDSKLKEHANKC